MSFSDLIGNDQNGLKDILFKKKKQQPSRVYLYLPFLSSFLLDRMFVPDPSEPVEDMLFHKELGQDLFFAQVELNSKTTRSGSKPTALLFKKVDSSHLFTPHSESNTRSPVQNETVATSSGDAYAGLEGSMINPFKDYPLIDYLIANRKAASALVDLLACANITGTETMWGGIDLSTATAIYASQENLRYFLLQMETTYNSADNGRAKGQYFLRNGLFSSTHQVFGQYQLITPNTLPLIFPNALLIQRLKHIWADYKEKFFSKAGGALKQSGTDVLTQQLLAAEYRGFSKDLVLGKLGNSNLGFFDGLDFINDETRAKILARFLQTSPALVDSYPVEDYNSLSETESGGFVIEEGSIIYTRHRGQIYGLPHSAEAMDYFSGTTGQEIVDRIGWDNYSLIDGDDVLTIDGQQANPITSALKDYMAEGIQGKSLGVFVESNGRLYWSKDLSADVAKTLVVEYSVAPPEPVIGVQLIIPDSSIKGAHRTSDSSGIPYLDDIAPVIPVASYRNSLQVNNVNIEIDVVPASELYRKYSSQNYGTYSPSWPETNQKLQEVFAERIPADSNVLLGTAFEELSISGFFTGDGEADNTSGKLPDIFLAEFLPPGQTHGSPLLAAMYFLKIIYDDMIKSMICQSFVGLASTAFEPGDVLPQKFKLYYPTNVAKAATRAISLLEEVTLPADLKAAILAMLQVLSSSISRLESNLPSGPSTGTSMDYVRSALSSLLMTDVPTGNTPLLPTDLMEKFSIDQNLDLLSFTDPSSLVGYVGSLLRTKVSRMMGATITDDLSSTVSYLVNTELASVEILNAIRNSAGGTVSAKQPFDLSVLDGKVTGSLTALLKKLNNPDGMNTIKFSVDGTAYTSKYVIRLYIKGFKQSNTQAGAVVKTPVENIKPPKSTYANESSLRIEDNCISATIDDYFGMIAGRIGSFKSNSPDEFPASLVVTEDAAQAATLHTFGSRVSIKTTADSVVFTDVILGVNNQFTAGTDFLTITKDEMEQASATIGNGDDLSSVNLPDGFYVRALKLIQCQLLKTLVANDSTSSSTSDFYGCEHVQITGFTNTPFNADALQQVRQRHLDEFPYIGTAGNRKLYPIVSADFNFDDYFRIKIRDTVVDVAVGSDPLVDVSRVYNRYLRAPLFGKFLIGSEDPRGQPLLYYRLSAPNMKGIKEYPLKPALLADFAPAEGFEEYAPIGGWLSQYIDPVVGAELSGKRLPYSVAQNAFAVLKRMSEQEQEQIKTVAEAAGISDLRALTTGQFRDFLDRLIVKTTINLNNLRDGIASGGLVQVAFGLTLTDKPCDALARPPGSTQDPGSAVAPTSLNQGAPPVLNDAKLPQADPSTQQAPPSGTTFPQQPTTA